MEAMPTIRLEELSGVALIWARKITGRGRRLRASKPKMRYTLVPHPWGGQMRQYDMEDAVAAYIWRMVAFYTSPRPEHQSMPVTASMDLPFKNHDDRQAYIDSLEPIIDEIVNAVDPREWHGVRRWGQALGMVGAPQYAEDGAIIYR